MPLAHERPRQSINLLLKKIKFSPIVSIQGPRQCGKSYLAKKILTQHLKSIEVKTLDEKQTRYFADQNPQLFLKDTSASHLVVDEVQKVPHLFDEMKAIVDVNRKPGQFIILGSTEFSIESKIKESLTGRLSRLKIYPFNLSEAKSLPLNPQKTFPFVLNKGRVDKKDMMKYLKNGGLPGIFVVKSDLEKQSLIKDWINLTTTRDIFQFKNKKLNSEIAERILEQIALLDEPHAGAIAGALGLSLLAVQNHLKVLKNLFVLDELYPDAKSAGKPIFFICDVGILEHYRASFSKKILTWLLIEFRSQMSYKSTISDKICYFKSARSQPIHFVNIVGSRLTAVKVVFSDVVDQRDLIIFESIKKKYPQHQFDFHILYGGARQIKMNEVLVSPWENIV